MRKMIVVAVTVLLAVFVAGAGTTPRAYDDATAGSAAQIRGDLDEAIRLYTRAIDSGELPASVLAGVYKARGSAHEMKGEDGPAITDYGEAIRLKHDHFEANKRMALLLATASDSKYRNGAEAVRLAKKAVSLQDSPVTHSILAAAYAEAGRFVDAVREQRKAIEMFDVGDKQEKSTNESFLRLMKRVKKRYYDELRLYEQGKPYHKEPTR